MIIGSTIPAALEQAIYGVYATHVVHLADRHGVFTELARRPATADALAATLGRDPETVERLLMALDAFGLLTRNGEQRYELPGDIRPYLDADGDRYLGGFVEHVVGSTAGRLDTLDGLLRLGKEAVDATRPDPFTELYADDASTRRFLTAMWQLSSPGAAELAGLADLTTCGRLVDVGGASGAFAIAALRAYPALRATVFDLPVVEPHLRENARRYGCGDRLDFHAGDFFNDELPPGTCIAFGYILSDWPDDVCVRLLRAAHRACAPGGRVLVMERLFDEDRRGPLGTAVMNLSMHVETRGRHRSAAEYLGLLREAGFTGGTVRPSTTEKHLVVADRD